MMRARTVFDIHAKDPFPGWQLRFIGVVLIRPYIWRTVIVQMWRLIPFSKLNPLKKLFRTKNKALGSFRDYLRMRDEISHGDANIPTRSGDILEWLNWCRTQLRLR